MLNEDFRTPHQHLLPANFLLQLLQVWATARSVLVVHPAVHDWGFSTPPNKTSTHTHKSYQHHSQKQTTSHQFDKFDINNLSFLERSFIGSYCIYCVSQLENQIVLPSRNSIIVYNAALGKATHSQYSRASCCSMLFLYPSSLNHGNEKLPFWKYLQLILEDAIFHD